MSDRTRFDDPATVSPTLPMAALLPRIGAAVDRHRRRAAARHGLTPTAIAALAALDGDGAPSHRDLAAFLGISPATLTPVLDALEASGLARRERDPGDRRVVRVHRTARGRESLAVAAPVVLPPIDPRHEPAVRSWLFAVLAAVDDEGRPLHRPPAHRPTT